jgi:DNA repair exonuclease SbcCD ATPase subunit
MRLKKFIITDFKGVKQKEYHFNSDTIKVSGKNGAGKSTIADAYFWLMCDKDYCLNSNPTIRPNDNRECTPTVTAVLDVEGKEITITKMQKCKKSKPNADGISTVSLTNSYEVNSVAYGDRDFKSKMAEYGLDFDNFLQLSHPDMFLSGMKDKKAREQMRNTLFAMSEGHTDLEIAMMDKSTSDIAKLLETYSKSEIEAMQNATIRKIKEVYGKDGEVLQARIEGLELAKVEIDVAELELAKNDLLKKIDDVKAKQGDFSKQIEEITTNNDEILRLQNKITEIKRQANEELSKRRQDLHHRTGEISNKIYAVDSELNDIDRKILNCQKDIEYGNAERKRLGELWKHAKAAKFDENTAICPTCHRELPEEEHDRLVSNFEKENAEWLKKIEIDGTNAKSNVDKAKNLLVELEESKKENEVKRNKLADDLDYLLSEFSGLPEYVDVWDREDVIALKAEISEREKIAEKYSSRSSANDDLKTQLEDLQEKLDIVNKRIALSENNSRIDEQIEELQAKRIEYEQAKADAEKILYQLSLLGRKKNELLTDEINKHFELVNFKLFDYRKNGEYQECCIPTYNGKDYGTATNTGLQMRMKLDIIKGLQKFYGVEYPVFVDGAECLDTDNLNAIKMDCQMIYLCVSDDTELKISF